MEQSQWEIIILKPTSVFLSFLADQFPDSELPEMDLLQIDTTAFALQKQASEEETFDEIERQFKLMFKHEISRWICLDACKEVEGSFLDFLRCFKFEFHSQIVLMEPSMTEGQHLLCIKPRSVKLKWMRASTHDQDEVIRLFDRVNLAHFVENSTVVVKNFRRMSEVQPFIKHHYQPFFNAEMLRLSDKMDQWPAVKSVQAFSRYFAVEIHTKLVHLH